MDKRKEILVHSLNQINAFWSYKSDPAMEIPDDVLIEKVFLYLDLDEIEQLFQLYPYSLIYKVWKEQLLSQEPYYHNLNKFIGWFYFNEEV